MNEDQIPKLVGVLVEHQKFFKRLLTKDAQWVIQNPYDAIQLMISGIESYNRFLLKPVSIIAITATTERFVAKDKFVINTDDNSLVKIIELNDNFIQWFLTGKGKVEEPIAKTILSYHKLIKSSVDGPIIAELGGEAKVETTLSGLFSLMEKQRHGEEGALLNNGYANIFYVRDQTGVLRTVYVYGDDYLWYVSARSVEDAVIWSAGSQVFYRNSDLGASEPRAVA